MDLFRNTTIVAVLIAAAGASAESSLDGFISFDDPYRCVANRDFGALVGGLIRWEEDGDSYKGALMTPPVPPAFRDNVGTPSLMIDGNEYTATVPLQGTWKGLPVRSLVVVQRVESEGGFYLVFDAPVGAVRYAANKAGFRIPDSGSEYRDAHVIGVTVGVEARDGMGALYCFDG